jgi:hypothetical protein
MRIQLSTVNPDFAPLLATGFQLDSVPDDGTKTDPIDPPDNQGGGSTVTDAQPPAEEELTEEETESQ